MLLNIFIPWFKYKLLQRSYFKTVRKKAHEQKPGKTNGYYRRSVLNLKRTENNQENKNWDPDQIELNSLRRPD